MNTKKELAAGAMIIAKDTGRLLLGRRSSDGVDGNFWSIFGGGFDEADGFPKNTVYREVLEETGHKIESISSKPLYVYTTNFLDYYTYLSFFSKEFKPKLNNEHVDYGWFTLDELEVANIHIGLRQLLNDRDAYDTLKKTIDKYAKKAE